MYYVYWIAAGARNYIGATVSPERRLRQHNSELTGGAYRTHDKGPWSYVCVVSGFRTWKESLQFEWAFKFACKRVRSKQNRILALETVIQMPRWTSNSPPASEVPLTVDYDIMKYEPAPRQYVKQKLTYKKKRNTTWKRKLHGVM